MTAEGPMLVERAPEGYAVLTLNRPEAMNALSAALRQTLAEAIAELAAEPSIRVLVLTGAGRAFCAGLDLKELGAAGGAPALAGAAADPVAAMAGFAGPVIAAVNGAAVTGGFELALACDVILASEEARFADTHARVGVLPGWGLSQRLPRLIGPGRAKELSLTGNFLGARQAEAWGLVNRVLPAGQLLPAARALARDMLSALPDMLPAMKRLIDDGYALPFAAAMALERERSQAHRARVTGEAVAGRVDAVVAHGKTQSSG
ncbi:MAG TPA: enoyl-CoA hydratase [Acetobacteraceae bacterium]|nr:enoyl-CoA hydratase [Acetobacteraceae bacterium]